MREKKVYLMFFLGIIALMSCSREPVAGFRTDKTEYEAGETVFLINTSIDADSYEWIFPNGETSNLETPSFRISDYRHGSLPISLFAYSKNRRKQSYASKDIQVKPAKGNATFWVSSGQYIVTVYLSGMSDQITRRYSSSPECNAFGCANFTLPAGTYAYYATGAIGFWEGDITIKPNGCSTMHLLDNKAKKVENPVKLPVKMITVTE
jgi:hypothetical protein